MGSQNDVGSVCSLSRDQPDDVRSANGGYQLMEPVNSGRPDSQAIELVSDVASCKQTTRCARSSPLALVGSKKLHGFPEFGQSISQGKNKWTATLIVRACSFQWIGVSS